MSEKFCSFSMFTVHFANTVIDRDGDEPRRMTTSSGLSIVCFAETFIAQQASFIVLKVTVRCKAWTLNRRPIDFPSVYQGLSARNLQFSRGESHQKRYLCNSQAWCPQTLSVCLFSYHLCDDNQYNKSIAVNTRKSCPIAHEFFCVHVCFRERSPLNRWH